MVFGMDTLSNGLNYSYSADMNVIIWNESRIISQINLDFPISRIEKTSRNLVIQGNNFFDIYDFHGNEIENVMGHEGQITCLYTTENEIFTGSTDRKIKVWDSEVKLFHNYEIIF